jgi:outer membrane protein assembly factor BamB
MRSGFVGLGLSLVSSALFMLSASSGAAPAGPVGIYTYHGDNMRTGWNSHETLLTPPLVASGGFGKLWSHPVDGQVYAQPLLAPAVHLGAAGTHNLVFVVTEHDSVYAFDADTGGDPLWKVSVGPSVPSDSTGVPCSDIDGPEYGITGTPVIDPAAGTLYVVAKTMEAGQQHYRLHALDITTGQDRAGWPVKIQGFAAGNGGGSSDGQIAFEPRIQNQRAALLLLDGRVIIAFGGHCDDPIDRYHGWVFSYDAADPRQPPAIFNTTPDLSPGAQESAGGIWQSGFGLAADAAGDVYFETGNGPVSADLGGRNVGDSFVRLHTAGGALTFIPNAANFFTPNSQQFLDERDLDLGSGGAMVIPEQTGTTTPRLLVGSGKDGVIRLLNRDLLGGYVGRVYAGLSDQALQIVPNPGEWPYRAVFGGPAYWEGPNGHYLFYTSAMNPLRRFRLGLNPAGGGSSWLIPDAESADQFGTGSISAPEEATPTPVISSCGLIPGTGIVWLLSRGDNTLRAYRADNLALLWNSSQDTGSILEVSVVKFTLPVVANGKVYAGTRTSILCYGLH